MLGISYATFLSIIVRFSYSGQTFICMTMFTLVRGGVKRRCLNGLQVLVHAEEQVAKGQ